MEDMSMKTKKNLHKILLRALKNLIVYKKVMNNLKTVIQNERSQEDFV